MSCTVCKDFKIVKIITAKSEYDAQALQQFTKIVSSQGEPITLIIDCKTYTSLPQHILTWCVFGTLLRAGLIDSVYVYQGNNTSSPTQEPATLKKSDLNFLHLSSFYFQLIMIPILE